jgi:hypothetical protein
MDGNPRRGVRLAPAVSALADITRESVLAAIAECDRMGRGFFRAWHGYRRSNAYVLIHEGREYDSKAIVGVAYGYAFDCPPLGPKEFSGGVEHIAGLLVRLGFTVRCHGETLTEQVVRAAKRMFFRLRRTVAAMTASTRAWLVGLVSCSKAKVDSLEPVPARDLYAPSYVFRKSREIVERDCDEWWVLSAEHGLVHPDTPLHRYDTTLAGAPKAIRERWYTRVRAALRELYEGRWVRFLVLAGQAYAEAVRGLGFGEVVEPLRGLGTGQRRKRLGELTRSTDRQLALSATE